MQLSGLRAKGIGVGITTGLMCLALLFAPLSADSDASEQRPNVLLISIDTTRADFLTFTDSETAKNMTALARHGTIFSEAITATSWTLPAHAQMFTGMEPPYDGTETDGITLDPLLPVLPQLLQQAGYFTVGIFNVRYLWADYGFGRGFDIYHSAMLERNIDKEEVRYAPRDFEARERMRILERKDYVTSQNVLPIARRALERASVGQPVFFFVHFFDPHNDYNPPAPWDTRFDPDYEGVIDGQGYLTNKEIFDELQDPMRKIGDRDLEHIKSLYRGEIAWTDRWVGELLDLFQQHGRLDDTLILITADHGEEFFEHANPGHRKSLYDEVVRVPLLVVPPREKREGLERHAAVQVTLSDLLPTILDFCDLDEPRVITGQSLRPAMYGEPFPDRDALLSLYTSKIGATGDRDHMQAYGIRTPEFKFLRSTLVEAGKETKILPYYFDLKADPEEQIAIRSLDDPRVRAAWKRLDDRLDEVRAHRRAYPRSSRENRTTDLPEDFTTEELKVLGYLDPDDPASLLEGLKPWGLEPLPRIDLPEKSDWRRALLVCFAFLAVGAAVLRVVLSRRRQASQRP